MREGGFGPGAPTALRYPGFWVCLDFLKRKVCLQVGLGKDVPGMGSGK